MYTLLYGLYKYIIQKDEYCVLILGLDNAGKTVRNQNKLHFIESIISLSLIAVIRPARELH